MAGYLRFPNINNVTLSGRIVKDVELKYSHNNQPRANICIAISHYYKDEHGNTKEEASFVDAIVFGKTAQICQECLKKGSPVLVEGSLKTRSYTDSNNVNRKITEIQVNRVYPLEREDGYTPNQNYNSQSTNQEQTYHNSYQHAQPKPNQSVSNNDNFPYNDPSVTNLGTEDDVPF